MRDLGVMLESLEFLFLSPIDFCQKELLRLKKLDIYVTAKKYKMLTTGKS